MKTITKILGLVIMMVLSMNLTAQRADRGERGDRDPGKRFDKMIEKAKEKLELSADQSVKLDQIVASHKAKVQTIMDNEDMSRKDTKNGLKELKDSFDADLSAILNPDQNEKWTKMQEKMQDKRKDRGEKGKKARKGKKGVEKDAQDIEDGDNDE